MQRLLRFFLIFLSVFLIYFLALPWIAIQLDHRFKLIWRLPFLMETIAVILILSGILLSFRYCWLQIFPKGMESKSARPGSLMHSLNFAISGTWLCGIGLAILLRSPCLLGFSGIVMITGMLCAGRMEEQELPARFTKVLSLFTHIPRWAILLFVLAITVAGLPALSEDKQPAPAVTEPGILVQIRCKPGTAFLWEADFNQHIRPAIEEVIAHGNTYTGFQFIKAALPAQPFDFMLIYTGKSFAALDKPAAPPQYAALFQREGTIRALSVLKEMLSYEDQVTVTIVYLERKR